MKKFIAYFDYLGFGQFIENNDLNYQKRIMGNIFRDIELALSNGKIKKATIGAIADMTQSKVNCINFSDTIVFWTNDDSNSSLIELLEVANRFNWQAILHFFPARGSVVYGEIEYVDFKQNNPAGGLYNINSVFGKGLVRAHKKAESQNWAGTVFDESIITELTLREYNLNDFLSPFAKKHKVPYKNEIMLPDEYVMSIVQGTLNDEALKNFGDGIIRNFSSHKKSINNKDVQEKINNTINFLKSYNVDDK